MCRRLVTGLTIAVICFSGTVQAEDLLCFPICEENGDQTEPEISSKIVVWCDERNGSANDDIYMYLIDEPNEYEVCTELGLQHQADINANVVVWADKRNGNYDVFGYDIGSDTEIEICVEASQEQRYPSISGDIVVWRDKRDYLTNSYDLYAYNLSTGTEFPVCTEVSGQLYPDISGNIVVWMDNRNASSGYDIYGFKIAEEQEFSICTEGTDQLYPKISGNIVVWQDPRNSLTTGADIYGYDIATQTEFPICCNAGNQIKPVISGNYVVWCDDRNGNEDIYGYNLETETEFPICTLSSSNQREPAIDGRTIVWQDYRNATIDIYGATIPEPSTVTVLSPNGDEMVQAGDAIDISWQSSGPIISSVEILFSNDNGLNWTVIESDLANTGEYQWDSSAVTSSAQYLIRVKDQDGLGSGDESDGVFTIFQCEGSLTADLNGDCFVDIEDFALFCQQWFTGGNPFVDD